jgi:hypothetical protein
VTAAAALLLLVSQELAPLVWNAVDAPRPEYGRALVALRKHPDGNWKRVIKVLAAGRPLKARAHAALSDKEQLRAALKRCGWTKGGVRVYDFGDTPGAFYRLDLPRDPVRGRVPVYLDLSLPIAHAGYAHVQPNWEMVSLMEQSGIPMSMTAGREFQSLVLSIVADLERRIPVDRSRIVTGGYSRGGNAAWYFGVHWPDRFSAILPASGYYPIDDKLLGNLDHVAVLAAVGVDRGHRDSNSFTAKLAETLRARKHGRVQIHRSTTRAVDGIFPTRALKWLGTVEGVAHPRRVRYALRDAAHGHAYWVEIRETAPGGSLKPLRILEPGGTVKETVYLNPRVSWVDVEVRDGNHVVVKSRNVKQIVLRLSPELFDFELDLRVRAGSRTRSFAIRPTVNRLVAGYRRDRDARRLYPAEVLLDLR